MLFRTYKEFLQTLTELLPGWDITLGVTKENLDGNTCFITHRDSVVTSADGESLVASTTYDLVFAQKRAAFTNRGVVELLEGGVRFSGYDEASDLHIFTAAVTLFGPRSLPDE